MSHFLLKFSLFKIYLVSFEIFAGKLTSIPEEMFRKPETRITDNLVVIRNIGWFDTPESLSVQYV